MKVKYTDRNGVLHVIEGTEGFVKSVIKEYEKGNSENIKKEKKEDKK